VVTSALAVAGVLLTPGGASADEPAVGPLLSYVVNATSTATTAGAAAAVLDVGGTVTQSWGQIGVVIARSTDPAFVSKVKASAHGASVLSAGATRTAALPAESHDTDGTADINAAEETEAYVPDTNETAATQSDMILMGARAAHEVSLGSPDVTVGVLDDGIYDLHADLAPVVDTSRSVNCVTAGAPDTTFGAWRPFSLTADYHGTHVAGTIAAAKNGVGVVGVAPGVKLAAVKVVNAQGFIFPEYAICGFVWAAEHNMQVTNNSYYIDPWLFWCENQADQAPVVEAVRRAVNYTTSKGILNVAAAGNEAFDLANKDAITDTTSPDDSTPVRRTLNPSCLDLPTEMPGVISVSSTTKVQQPATFIGPGWSAAQPTKSSFSNYGLGAIDVAAPGSSIISTSPSATNPLATRSLNGTSMASPHVAGVAALLVSKHPGATPDYIAELLRKQAMPMACPTSGSDFTNNRCKVSPTNALVNGFFGYGMTNAYKAVTEAEDVTAPTVAVTGFTNGQQFLLGAPLPTAGCSTTDAGSGVAQEATVAVTGGPTVGYFTATCSGARDRAGNMAAPVSSTYQVIFGWSDFAQPIDLGAVNTVKAGSAVPVKFGLAGDQGLAVLAAGYPKVQQVACVSGAPQDAIEETVTAGSSSLTYQADSGRYIYVWKTAKSLAGTCGRLEVKLIDGTSHFASFQFS
jgi:subtilisin family serine protease